VAKCFVDKQIIALMGSSGIKAGDKTGDSRAGLTVDDFRCGCCFELLLDPICGELRDFWKRCSVSRTIDACGPCFARCPQPGKLHTMHNTMLVIRVVVCAGDAMMFGDAVRMV